MTSRTFVAMVRLFAVAGFLLGASGCNQQALDNLAAQIEAAASPTPSPVPSTSASPAPVVANPPPELPSCGYTVSYTYDLGPGINVNENFMSGDVQVVEAVTASNASDCPQNIVIPAVGVTQQGYVYEVSSYMGKVSLYAARYDQPYELSIASGASLPQTGSASVTAVDPQISNDTETQIFDSGILVSSGSESTNASLVLQITYTYAAAAGSGGGQGSSP